MKKRYLASFGKLEDAEKFMKYVQGITSNEVLYDFHYNVQEWEYEYRVYELEES